MASNGAPAISGRKLDADGGMAAPKTCEIEQPARSNTLPSLKMRLSPPPPSGRRHASRLNFTVSTASTAAVIRSCNASK
jgi:hypothetical protein